MFRLFDIADNAIVERENTEHPESAVWIDSRDPTEEERKVLQDATGVALPDLEEASEIESSARFFSDTDGMHIHSLFVTQPDGLQTTATVACLLQKERLITVRGIELEDFRLLRERARRGQIASRSPQDLLVDIFEQKTGRLADLLEHIHRHLEDVGKRVLGNERERMTGIISRLAELEDSNGKVRLCLMDTQRSVLFLQRSLAAQHPDLNDACEEIIQDINALMSHATFLFEKINFLMASAQGFISIEQNKIIKIFSIAAVVFLPPTLVASIYGMNFDHMPELEWLAGYPWAIGLMILSGIAPYWIFKRKGWL